MKLAFQSGFAQPRPNRGDNRTKTHFHGLILETRDHASLARPLEGNGLGTSACIKQAKRTTRQRARLTEFSCRHQRWNQADLPANIRWRGGDEYQRERRCLPLAATLN